MKKPPRVITAVCVCTIALFAAAGLFAQDADPGAGAAPEGRWQHLALEHAGSTVPGSPELARKINRLGDEGWQLVDVETVSEAGSTVRFVFFFKRPAR